MPFFGGGGGTGAAPEPASRETVTFVTEVLADNQRELGTIEMGKTYLLLAIDMSGPARVRIYDSLDHQTADSSRGRGTDPLAGINHGIILDYALEEVVPSDEPRPLSPMVVGATSMGTTVPVTVDNLSDDAQAITVTLVFLRTE